MGVEEKRRGKGGGSRTGSDVDAKAGEEYCGSIAGVLRPRFLGAGWCGARCGGCASFDHTIEGVTSHDL